MGGTLQCFFLLRLDFELKLRCLFRSLDGFEFPNRLSPSSPATDSQARARRQRPIRHPRWTRRGRRKTTEAARPGRPRKVTPPPTPSGSFFLPPLFVIIGEIVVNFFYSTVFSLHMDGPSPSAFHRSHCHHTGYGYFVEFTDSPNLSTSREMPPLNVTFWIVHQAAKGKLR